MGNRSQEQNAEILLAALRQAGEDGLTIDEARLKLSSDGNISNSLAKKVLEYLRIKGFVKVKMGKSGVCYTLIPGR